MAQGFLDQQQNDQRNDRAEPNHYEGKVEQPTGLKEILCQTKRRTRESPIQAAIPANTSDDKPDRQRAKQGIGDMQERTPAEMNMRRKRHQKEGSDPPGQAVIEQVTGQKIGHNDRQSAGDRAGQAQNHDAFAQDIHKDALPLRKQQRGDVLRGWRDQPDLANIVVHDPIDRQRFIQGSTQTGVKPPDADEQRAQKDQQDDHDLHTGIRQPGTLWTRKAKTPKTDPPEPTHAAQPQHQKENASVEQDGVVRHRQLIQCIDL